MKKNNSKKKRSNRNRNNMNRNIQVQKNQAQDQNEQAVQRYSSYQSSGPKRSMFLRILILVVAGLMFLGVITIPFMSVFRAG